MLEMIHHDCVDFNTINGSAALVFARTFVASKLKVSAC